MANDHRLDQLKILLVEDNYQSLNLTKKMLMDLHVAQIYTAKDGFEALQLLSTFDGEDFVDIILCDWNMPRMTGVELLKQIRTCDPDMPFLMLTGVADYTSVTDARAHGVTGYIRKPFSLDELHKKLKLVSRVLSHRRKAETGV